jgi:Holliday junction DNA helicase RuvA
MLALITGQPQLLSDRLIVITGGLGYGVFVGQKLLAQAVHASTITLYLHTYVREDRLELYGFTSVTELQLFEQVLSVSGVGPKMALALVDAGANQLVSAVQEADLSFFTSVPRVGKKLGQKIVIELKSKLGGLVDLDLGPLSSKQQDVLAALTSLGFSDAVGHSVLKQVDVENLPLDEAVKAALKLTTQM